MRPESCAGRALSIHRCSFGYSHRDLLCRLFGLRNRKKGNTTKYRFFSLALDFNRRTDGSGRFRDSPQHHAGPNLSSIFSIPRVALVGFGRIVWRGDKWPGVYLHVRCLHAFWTGRLSSLQSAAVPRRIWMRARNSETRAVLARMPLRVAGLACTVRVLLGYDDELRRLVIQYSLVRAHSPAIFFLPIPIFTRQQCSSQAAVYHCFRRVDSYCVRGCTQSMVTAGIQRRSVCSEYKTVRRTSETSRRGVR